MAGYVRGCSRRQMAMCSLDEGVSADNMVRVLDGFVESVDLGAPGFLRADGADAAEAGRPSYSPAALAKLLLYGSLEGRSSRKLERECERNVEVKWLLGDVRPSYKTTDNFRRGVGGVERGVGGVLSAAESARGCR